MMDRIGRYQIVEKLGQGGMAEVYKAYDPSIDRTLAIKLLREERCSDPEYRARFLRESRAAGILSHANIATVYDVGEIDNRPFIVMEYLEGETFDQVMKSGEKLSLNQILTFGIELAKALSYAHEKGIVHRDVKPSNIVLLRNSNTAKVTDFGIARMASSDVTQQTQLGEILGTPHYMSPEQVVGTEVDARSDLFSLGVILYQLITGERPFDADTLTTLLLKITTDSPRPISEIAPDTPPSLQRIVEKLLNKRPEKRFQNGSEVTVALIKVLKAIEAEDLEKDLPRIIPLRIKWMALMGTAVAVTMIISSVVIYNRQHKAMMDRVVQYGSSLVKFIAEESAVPVLSEDWVSIELFVNDVMERQDFNHLEVLDHQGIIRGSSDPARLGKAYEEIPEASLLSSTGGARTLSYELEPGVRVLDFEAPILFQEKAIGHVHLGIPQAPFQKVARLTIYMMIIFMLVTIVAVIVVTYILGASLSNPVNTTINAMNEILEGNYGHRIDMQRKDEFGRLYAAFDRMAASLDSAQEEDGNDETVVVPAP